MICRCLPEDAEKIAALEKECFGDPWDGRSVEEMLSGRSCRAAADKNDAGGLNGYVLYSIVLDTAEVLRICVGKELRRRGTGEKLLDFMISDAEKAGCEKIFLEVRSGNTAAKGLYAKKGFKQISVRRRYYGNGDDALVFLLELGKNNGD